MSEITAREPVSKMGDELRQKVSENVTKLRDDAFSSGVIADIFGVMEIGGTALLADVVLNTHVTQVGMGNPDRLFGVGLILGAEIMRKGLRGMQKSSLQVANNLAAQLILDELKEKEGEK